jgi:ferritin-like metal-binding protein YciE
METGLIPILQNHASHSEIAFRRTLSSPIGSGEGATTAIFRDQLVKDPLADYASEPFEVACYTALVRAATEFGYDDVARVCTQNLQEDQAMAAWLLPHIPSGGFAGCH